MKPRITILLGLLLASVLITHQARTQQSAPTKKKAAAPAGDTKAKAVVSPPKPFIVGGTAFLRVKQYTPKTTKQTDSKSATSILPMGGASLLFGETLTLVERRDGSPTMWIVSKDEEKTQIPEYLLTTSQAEIDFLKKANRVPKTMSYVYGTPVGAIAFWGPGILTGGIGGVGASVNLRVESQGSYLSTFPSGTSPFALVDNAVLFDNDISNDINTYRKILPVFDADKKPFLVRSTFMYYCVSGEDKPAFEAIDLLSFTIFTSAARMP